ncbi:GNAT family N-acetyltransferase, partial [Candidatus Poribacteria bacterium]|nr:GNAT family N-acetyltransferase [Candidatus Poribacteria bacterium]
MEISDIYPYEGPRTPKESEYSATIELNRATFFRDTPIQQAHREWPMFLRKETRKNSFIMLYEGQPVSLITRLTRDIFVRGHKMKMGFIGGVCTHPDHRGKGLAGTVLAATIQRFIDTDVDFVYISGARRLYYSAGANHIGGFSNYLVPSNVSHSSGKDISIRKASLEDAELLVSISEKDETRFVRDKIDYELVIENGHCSGGQCIFNIIESGSQPVAYIATRGINYKEGKWTQNVFEYHGDREAIFAALLHLAKEPGPNGNLVVEVKPGEVLGEKLRSIGIEPIPGRIGGTVKVVNFTGTMEKLRPFFAQKFGNSFSNSLEFSAGNGRYVISGEGGYLEIDGEDNMVWTLLGAPPDKHIENVKSTGLMKEALDIIFP